VPAHGVVPLFAYLSEVLAAKIRGDPIPLLT